MTHALIASLGNKLGARRPTRGGERTSVVDPFALSYHAAPAQSSTALRVASSLMGLCAALLWPFPLASKYGTALQGPLNRGSTFGTEQIILAANMPFKD